MKKCFKKSMYCLKYLPALARLLPTLKTVAAVVEAPKFPILKLTAAALAFNPKPPKLNPPAVVFAAPSPPNPAKREQAARKARQGRVSKRERKTVLHRITVEHSGGYRTTL